MLIIYFFWVLSHVIFVMMNSYFSINEIILTTDHIQYNFMNT